MIIESIKLKNFRSHRDTELFFDRGISVLVGENGAGKSSILEAISFALFKQHVVKIDDLIRRGAGGLEVELVFEHNGRRYVVIRKKRAKSAPESRLFVKPDDSVLGDLIHEGDKAVTEEIKQILQTDETLFLNAVYIRQGEIAGLLDATASERKNIVGRLLGIDALQKAWGRMPEVVRDFELKKAGFEMEVKGKADLEAELGNTKKELKVKERDKIMKREELTLQEKGVEELKGKSEGFDKKKERFTELSLNLKNQREGLKEKKDRESRLLSKLKGISEAEAELKKLRPGIEQIPHLEKLQELKGVEDLSVQRLNELNEKLKRITDYEGVSGVTRADYVKYCELEAELKRVTKEREGFSGVDRELKRIEEGISGSQEKVTRLNDEISQALEEASVLFEYKVDSLEQLRKLLSSRKIGLGDSLKGVDSKLTESRDDVSGLKARNLELKKAVSDLKKAQGKCPVCNTPLTEEHKTRVLREYSAREISNDKEIRELDSRIKVFESEKGKLSGLKESMDNVPLDLIESKSGRVLEETKGVRKRTVEGNKLRERVERLNELNSLLSERGKLKQGLEVVYRKHQSAQDFLGKYGGDKSLLEASVKSETDKLSGIRAEYRGCASELETIPEDPGGELDRLRGLKARCDELSGVIKERVSLGNELAEVRSGISGLEEGVSTSSMEFDALRYDEKEHESIKSSLETSRKKLTYLLTSKEKLDVEIKGLCREAGKLGLRLEGLALKEEELVRLQKFISFLSELRCLFDRDGLQRGLRVKARPAIELFTREVFAGFDMGYSSVSVDDDYNLWLHNMDGSKSVDMISGGERIAVALAFRLGIARVLSGGRSELLILDEPTTHLDSYRRQELVQIFKRLKVLPQVILVTHEPELEGAADQLFKVERRGSESVCTVG